MILIIGGSGFIGYYLHQGFVKSKKRVISTYNTNKIEEENFIRLDVNNKKNLGKLINELKPSIIIYAVGITDVDLCEKNKKLAKEINCDGIKNIVDVTKNRQTKIVYISTSAVFDGSKKFYVESDKTNPISYYGKSKLDGEKIVQNSGMPYVIIRTDQPYGWKEKWHHTNSVLRILENLENKEKHNEIIDWYNTPTFIDDFVTSTKKILSENRNGVFHVVGSDFKNRFQFAKVVAEVFKINKNDIKSINSKKLGLPAKRANVKLTNGQKRKTNIKMSNLRTGLKKMKESMKEEEEFKFRNQQFIKKMNEDGELKKNSKKFYNQSSKHEYSYHFSWLGRPIIQYPQDLIALQEVIWSTKPDLIIETGIARGGSLIFSASILEMISKGEVLGIDIDIRKHNRQFIEKHKLFKRITMIEGSSTDKKIVKKVHQFAKDKKNVLLLLDSLHTQKHVLQELNFYSDLIKKNNYIIVYDTVIEDMPENAFKDRPWSKKNNPKTAVREFLRKNKEFKLDKKIENKLLITSCPDGFLKRIT
mgnify:CR=1 FL=1